MFDKYSKEAEKEQYLIPYFIAGHPGTTDEDMLQLALWLKRNGFRADQVQNFYPSPMASATAMYHSGKNPLKRVGRNTGDVVVAKGAIKRRLHKAFLRYHDPENWPMLRQTLKKMGRDDLIGNGKMHWSQELNFRRIEQDSRRSILNILGCRPIHDGVIRLRSVDRVSLRVIP